MEFSIFWIFNILNMIVNRMFEFNHIQIISNDFPLMLTLIYSICLIGNLIWNYVHTVPWLRFISFNLRNVPTIFGMTFLQETCGMLWSSITLYTSTNILPYEDQSDFPHLLNMLNEQYEARLTKSSCPCVAVSSPWERFSRQGIDCGLCNKYKFQ